MPRSSVPPILCLAIIVSACSSPLASVQQWTASQDEGRPGAIAMIPNVRENVQCATPSGCQQPAAGVYVCERLHPDHGFVVLNIQCAPIPLQEAKQTVEQQLVLEEPPEPLGSFRGSTLTWQRYEMRSALPDQGLPELPDGAEYRFDVALAEPEGGFCMAAVITLPGDWEEDPAFYENLFTHVMYNTVALPWPASSESEGSAND